MKKTFFAGLITFLPLVLTLMIFVFLIDFLTAPFEDTVKDFIYAYEKKHDIHLPSEIDAVLSRLIALVLLVIFTFFLGIITRWFLINALVNLLNKIFSKIPFVKAIFKVLKDLSQALFKTDRKKRTAFQRAVLAPFPSEKSSCVSFISGEIPPACAKKVPNLVPVFVPTAPHPISGYLMMVPKEKVLEIEMSNEDAVKLTVSCGMILPKESPSHEAPP